MSNEKLKTAIDAIVAHRIGVERYASFVAGQLELAALEVEREIELRLRKALISSSKQAGINARLRSALSGLRNVGQPLRDASDKVADEWLEFFEYEASWLADNYYEFSLSGKVIPIQENAADAVDRDHLGDKTLRQWLDKLQSDHLAMVAEQMRIGFMQQEEPEAILARMIGTPAAGNKDGVFARLRSSARTLGRTGTSMISGLAQKSFFDANAGNFPHLLFVAILDSRTSEICLRHAGEVYPVETAPTPPLHPNCRSTLIPYISGMPEVPTLDAWLRSRPKVERRDILGPVRAKLFDTGKLRVDRYVPSPRDAITLKQLRRRDAAP
jgi:SPP1 gp7 family putative phage head morphogenesis protein